MVHVVSFPGLGLEFTLNRVAFEILGRPVYWYGIIIACGLLLAVRVDRARVGGEELGPLLVAMSPTPVSDGGSYRALIGALT